MEKINFRPFFGHMLANAQFQTLCSYLSFNRFNLASNSASLLLGATVSEASIMFADEGCRVFMMDADGSNIDMEAV